MERLLAIIFVIIGIVNFAAKQQQKQNRGQGGMKRQQSRNELPGQPRSYKAEQPRKAVWEYMPSPIMMEESEGAEAEDRSIQGSMVYVEDSQSNEGVSLELPKPSPKVEVMEREEEEAIFEITADNLLSSIVMAEVLGPPRSMKRSIR